MPSDKTMHYSYTDDTFYMFSEPLIKKGMDREQENEIMKRLIKIGREVEKIQLELPKGATYEFRVAPRTNGKGYRAWIDITVFEKGMEEWKKFIQKEGGVERYIDNLFDERRAKLIERVKEFRKELERDAEIDVQVLGKSGMHRVYGKGKDLECDCKLFEKLGECHHVALVKTKLAEGKKLEKDDIIEPPMLVFKRDVKETTYDKDTDTLYLPLKDKNKTLTIRTLHNYGYGLGAMKEMHIVPRKFKIEHLVEVVHGREFEEVMDRINEELKAKEQEKGKEQEAEQSEGMEMGA